MSSILPDTTATTSVAASKKTRPIRIFIKGLNWVGDAIMATPAITQIRRAFPEAEITLMVRPWVEPVYKYNHDINRLWVHDDSESHRSFFKAAKRIRAENFTLGIALPNSIRSALLLYLGGVKKRIGYGIGMRPWLLNQSIKLDPETLKLHQVYYYLRIIEQLCGKSKKPVLTLNAGDTEREEVRRHLLTRGLDPTRRLFGIAPGSINSNAKRWLPERFAALADRLAEEYRAEILLLGSAREKDVVERVKAASKHPGVHAMAGDLNLSQVIALIERLEGLVTNDSGSMHIAAALKTPTVAIFGPTEFNTTYPYSERAFIVRKQGLACSPCMLRECPIDHPCMTQVPVEAVAATFDRLLAPRPVSVGAAPPTFHEMMVNV